MSNFWKKFKKPILCLAPMAGITDSAFRQICKHYGADVVYTEMTSVDGLYYDSKKTLAMLKFVKSERPIVIQLFGKKPELFSKAAKVAEHAGFDGIDINFGCPAKKVVAHGGGVTLMRDLRLCKKIIATTIKATKLPVSVKIRAGINRVTALDFVKAINNLPVAVIMIHGRTYKQGFSGPVNYEIIKEVKKQFKGAVIANGGVYTPQDAKAMLEKTKADGVGLARGLYGKPWLFKQVRDYLETGEYQKLNFDQIKKVAIKHARLAQQAKERHGIIEMRKHLAWYVKGFPGASQLRAKLVRVENIDEIKAILKGC
jgi:tRNA-dihydrouridine synthase B